MVSTNPKLEKLIETVKKNSIYEKGEVCLTLDTKKPYRYDYYKSRYAHTQLWLVRLFNEALVECGIKEYERLLQHGNFSVHCDKPRYKGEVAGKIKLTELIFLET